MGQREERDRRVWLRVGMLAFVVGAGVTCGTVLASSASASAPTASTSETCVTTPGTVATAPIGTPLPAACPG